MRTMTDHRPDTGPPQRHRSRSRGTLYGLGLLALVAILALGLGAALRANDAATGPTVVSSVQPGPGVSPPTVDQTTSPTPGWTALVGQLLDQDAALRVHPNPDGVALYMTPDHPDFATTVAAQQRLLTSEVHYDPAPTTPTLKRAIDQGDIDGERQVRVTFTTPRYRLLDAAGAVIVDTPSKIVNVTWRLRYDDGRWRIAGYGA